MLLVAQGRRVEYLEAKGMKKYEGRMMEYAAETLSPV